MIEVEMELEDKEYKSVYRYREVAEDKPPILNYLYIKKYAFGKSKPSEVISVRIKMKGGE